MIAPLRDFGSFDFKEIYVDNHRFCRGVEPVIPIKRAFLGSLSIVGVKIVKCNFYYIYMYVYMYANINSSSYVGNVEKSKTYPYYPHICKF